MYSKEEKKEMKLAFWNTLEEAITQQGKARGRNITWLSYPTRIKDLYFRMELQDNAARMCIDLQFLNDGVREVFFEQFQEFENILNQTFTNKVSFVKDYEHTNGKTISRIYTEITPVTIFNKSDWPKMHEFLIENFLNLDEFWVEFSEVFYNLK
ncbi:MAG: DUF4268 domain-containing protein [Putridiphycobacter sp.]